MPSNEQPQGLQPYSEKRKEWKGGNKIGSTNLNNIEEQIDELTKSVLNIDNRLVDFVGANSTTNGVKGVVPAPQAGDEDKYLKGDGTWDTPAARHGRNEGSVIEGSGSIVGSLSSYAHAEGSGTMAANEAAHAEGSSSQAIGDASHAEGNGTQASGRYSHAEGDGSRATENDAHAEGSMTVASGGASHAEGISTIANHQAQHVFGRYNIGDPSTAEAINKGTYIEIVGNGTSSARSNARTLDWEGNEVIAGNITATSFTGSGANLTNIPGTVVGLATSSATGAMSSADKVKLDELPTNTQLQNNYVAKSSVSDASGIPNADTAQYGLVKVGSNINVDNGTISIPLATSSSPGIVNIGDGLSINNGTISNNLNIKNGTGTGSIVVGTTLFGETSTASGNNSFASGHGTQATGGYTHTEGYYTIASNGSAHAEGESTNASGWVSHAEGYNTIANHKCQHVFGEYNIGDTSTAGSSDRGDYIEIVGNGTGSTTSERSNARTLDWSGNEWLAGSISASNFKLNNYDISFGRGEALWTTEDTSQFAGNSIMLSGENKNNYDFYVVSFRYNHETAYKILFNPGRLHTNIDEIRRESFTSSGIFEYAYRRNIVVARSGNSIYIGDCIKYNYTDLNNGTVENTVLIPLNVVGYYLGRTISSLPS